ncbi:hypothetical protein ACS0TY_015191 [Phlomoides rotata]
MTRSKPDLTLDQRNQPDLTLDQRNQIAHFLLAHNSNCLVQYGKTREAAELLGVTRRLINYIWQSSRQQVSEGVVYAVN